MDVLAGRLEFVVEAASRAVSVHNTQPWRFRLSGDGLELIADRSRQLAAADPRGRELVLSCGAALYNARLAMAMLGHSVSVALLPHPAEPDVLARLTVTGSASAGPRERQLFAAIPHRHTHRGAFSPDDVPRDLLVAGQEAVLGEGARLHFVETPGARRALSEVVAAADRAQRADPGIQQELTAWTAAPGENRRDGVPPTAYPAGGSPQRVAFPIRDFAAGRGWGFHDDPGEDGLRHPVAVLTTDGDQPADWLVAGQALQRMLLVAATRWIFAALFSQPLERSEARFVVRDVLGTPEFPQMIAQLGHSPVTTTTARRPVSDVLVNGTAADAASSPEA